MHEMTETFQNLSVNSAYACAAAVGTLCIVAMFVHSARKLTRAAKKLAAASLVGAMLIGGMVVVGTDGAGTKPGTNQMENGEWRMENVGGSDSTLHSPLSILHLKAALPVVTDDDIAAGWRVVSVSSNVLATATFTMPTHATVWESAQAECKMKN